MSVRRGMSVVSVLPTARRRPVLEQVKECRGIDGVGIAGER